MSKLSVLSNELEEVVRVAGAAVVAVRGGRRAASGVVVAEDLVVTAVRAVGRDEGVTVVLADGTARQATLVGRDLGTELALLGVEGGGLAVPRWRPAAEVAVGALVVAVGRPREQIRATLGMVSGVGGAWQTGSGGDVDAWIDVDGSLPRGFSGGALAGADGALIGMNTHGLTRTGAVVPAATVARVVAQLQERGSTTPGYLGVGFFPALLGERETLIAVSVEPGGPGEGAGVLVGDALQALDNTPVTGLRHLLGLLYTKGSGAVVELSLLRSGAAIDLSVTLGERPARRRGGARGRRR